MKIIIAALVFGVLIWTSPNTEAKNLNKQVAPTASIKKAKPIITEQPKPEPQAVATQPVVEPVQEIAPTPAPVTPPVPTSKEGLMAAAGIAPSDYQYVDYIVSRESSWNQQATEPTTQAHGLVQALPFSKTGCGWDDAVCTLSWGQKYAISRYGSWAQAYYYWQNHRNW